MHELRTYENEEAEKSVPAQGENTVRTSVGNMNGERGEGTSIGSKMACLKQYMKRKCMTILMIVIAFFVSMFAGSYILADTIGYPWLVLLLQKKKKIGSDSACGFSMCLVLL